jgi:hypothetical protein
MAGLRQGAGEPAHLLTGVKGAGTLWGKSQRLISNARGVRVTEEPEALSRFPRVFDLPNRVTTSYTPVRIGADLIQGRERLTVHTI